LSKEFRQTSTIGMKTLWLWGTMGLALLLGVTWYQVPLVSSQGMVVRAHFQEGNVPSHPSDPAWETVTPLPLPLSGQIITRPVWPNPSVRVLSIRSIHNGKEVAFFMEWQDATKNETLTPGVFRDGAARGLIRSSSSFVQHPAMVVTNSV